MNRDEALAEIAKIGQEQEVLDLIARLNTRAAIRRQIPTRKSVAEGKPDRIADLLEEAAAMLAAFHRLHFVAPIAAGPRDVVRLVMTTGEEIVVSDGQTFKAGGQTYVYHAGKK
jgi:hypothetical protein